VSSRTWTNGWLCPQQEVTLAARTMLYLATDRKSNVVITGHGRWACWEPESNGGKNALSSATKLSNTVCYRRRSQFFLSTRSLRTVRSWGFWSHQQISITILAISANRREGCEACYFCRVLFYPQVDCDKTKRSFSLMLSLDPIDFTQLKIAKQVSAVQSFIRLPHKKHKRNATRGSKQNVRFVNTLFAHKLPQ